MRQRKPVLLALSIALGSAIALIPASPLSAKTEAAATQAADGEALATLVVVDQHEVETAKQALGKGVSGAVRDFANRMQDEHGKNLTDTRAVAADTKVHLAETAAVKALKKKGLGERQMLQKLSGEAYSKAYVDAMVKGHTEVLSTLDDKLIPQATNAKVIAHLKTTREHVAAHLAAAQALQAK